MTRASGRLGIVEAFVGDDEQILEAGYTMESLESFLKLGQRFVPHCRLEVRGILGSLLQLCLILGDWKLSFEWDAYYICLRFKCRY